MYQTGVSNIGGLVVAGAGTTAKRVVAVDGGVFWINLDNPAAPFLQYYTGTVWVDIVASEPTLPAWSLAGNTVAAGNKMGSLNAQAVIFIYNNIEIFRIIATQMTVAQDIFVAAEKRVRVGAVEMYDDPGGMRRFQAVQAGNTTVMVRGSGTSASNILFTSFLGLTSLSDVRIVPSNNATAELNYSQNATGKQTILSLGRFDGSADLKQAIIRSVNTSTAGVLAPDIYIHAGQNTLSSTRQNVYICHNGTVAAGLLGVGQNVATSQVDIFNTNGYSQLRLRTQYTPTSSADPNGQIGDVCYDDDYHYYKTAAGWKRAALTAF